MRKQFLVYWYNPHNWEKELERRRKKKFYKKMTLNKQRGEKYKIKYYDKPSPENQSFFKERSLIVPSGKITVTIKHVKK